MKNDEHIGYPRTHGSFGAKPRTPAQDQRANLLGIVLCTCVGIAAVMLTVKLGFILFN
jgi:hypothetical protein